MLGAPAAVDRAHVARLAAEGPPGEQVGLEPFAPPEVMPGELRGERRATLFVWVVLPYVSVTIFVVGHFWRYRHDQFGWTTRSTQLLERRLLAWGSPLFHFGALAVIGGHVLGILVPASVTEAVGVAEHVYHHLATIAGSVAGLVCVAGLFILRLPPRHRRAASRVTTTLARPGRLHAARRRDPPRASPRRSRTRLFGTGYDYRETVAPWFRGLLRFQPETRHDRRRPARLPAPRDHRLGALRAVAVHAARARLERPVPVPRPTVHPVPEPVRGDPPRGPLTLVHG